MRNLLFTLTAAAALIALSPVIDSQPAQADDYWPGYWSWYDGTYRPYVTRRYYAPSYDYGYVTPYPGAYYGPSYGHFPGDYYYGRRYYGDYYGAPNVGYLDVPGGGGQVRVGPLRFGWR